MSWEPNSARGALSARLGGRHPGPHSLLQTTQPQGISLCLLRLGGSGGLPSPARATTVESRRYGTPHAAAHNRLQDSEVARLQCEMDRMKQQHTANILDSMPRGELRRDVVQMRQFNCLCVELATLVSAGSVSRVVCGTACRPNR